MALSRRSDRRDKKSVAKTPAFAENGSGGSTNGSAMGFTSELTNGSVPDEATPKLDPIATEHMQRVLLQRNLLTQEQIDQVLGSDPLGSDLGDILVNLGMLNEHDLTEARSEISGPARSSTSVWPIPNQRRWRSIPDAVAREHFVIPIASTRRESPSPSRTSRHLS